MLPEVAYVKLAWALGQTTDLGKVKDLMLNPIAGEITEREPYNGYLIFQGGIPRSKSSSRSFISKSGAPDSPFCCNFDKSFL
jgi:glutamyl-tRNA(Gln) amidotransferase subunit D